MIELDLKYHDKPYEELTSIFNAWIGKWNPVYNNFRVKDYFDEGMGVVSALKSLENKGLISSKSDFKGIYVFLKSGKPFYVGISKHVVQRIVQHVKGKNHFTSSLSYRLGADKYYEQHGKKHDGGREGLDFDKNAEPAKKELMNCDLALMPVENDLELYLFEVFTAMKLGTLTYNEFKTH